MILTIADIGTAARALLADRTPLVKLTLAHAAGFALLVYKTGGDPAGWVAGDFNLVAATPPDSRGHDGLAALHAPTRTLIVANRGVEGFSNIVDLEAAFAMHQGRGPGSPMEQALDFLAAARADAGAVSEILCVGHSMGGGLAEAQVALARPWLTAAGAGFDGPIWGAGFGSAAFGDAVAALAADRGFAIEPDIKLEMSHHVRAEDLIWRNFGARKMLGTRFFCADVWRWRFNPSDGRATPYWRLACDQLENHMMALYAAFFDRGPQDHILRREAGYELRADRRPSARRYMAIPAADR
jgi:hypothetical protein